jgi:hypothetical protein
MQLEGALPSMDPALSQINPVRTHKTFLWSVHFNITLQHSLSPKLYLSYKFPNQNLLYISHFPHVCYKTKKLTGTEHRGRVANTHASYSEGPGFKSRPGGRLS